MATYQIERRKRGILGWVFLCLFWAFNVLMLISIVSGLANVSASYGELSSSAARAGASIGTAMGLTMMLVIWLTGAVVLGMCALLTQGPKIIETVEATNGAIDRAPTFRHHRLLIWAGAAAFAVVILVTIGTMASRGRSQSTTPGDQAYQGGVAESTPPTAAAPEEPVSPWRYESERDDMRDATNRFASALSSNVVDMGFPYESVRMSIVLRDHAVHGRDILLTVNEGQFVCRFRGCTISAKFDDGEIQTFSVNQADAGASDVLFIQNQSRFLTALQSAERVTIEAQFYNRGNEQFSFNIEGLQWE